MDQLCPVYEVYLGMHHSVLSSYLAEDSVHGMDILQSLDGVCCTYIQWMRLQPISTDITCGYTKTKWDKAILIRTRIRRNTTAFINLTGGPQYSTLIGAGEEFHGPF